MIGAERIGRTRHGSPYDRGCADSFYGRPRSPHWYPNGSPRAPRVEAAEMSRYEIAEYNRGFDENEARPELRKYPEGSR